MAKVKPKHGERVARGGLGKASRSWGRRAEKAQGSASSAAVQTEEVDGASILSLCLVLEVSRGDLNMVLVGAGIYILKPKSGRFASLRGPFLVGWGGVREVRIPVLSALRSPAAAILSLGQEVCINGFS